jgi:hypothetical protein
MGDFTGWFCPALLPIAEGRNLRYFFDAQRALRAGLRSFAGLLFQTGGRELCLQGDDAVIVQAKYFGTYFGANAISAACGSIGDNA